MRKSIISLTFCMLMGGVSILAQTNSADFETMGDANGSYTTRTSTAGWTAKNAALVSIDGTIAPTLNGKTSAVGEIKSPLLADGINSLSFNYTNTFSESNGVKLEVSIFDKDNILVEKKTLENTSVTTKEIYTYTYEDIAWEGEFYIQIKNLCPTNNSSKNKDRVSIWNLSWESYSENAPVLAPANLAFAQEAYEVDVNDTNTIDLGLTKDTDAPVVYTSSNEAFTVDENGIVSFTAMGTTTITATTEATDAFKAGSATCTVTVNDRTVLLDEITTGFFEGFTATSYTAYDASSTYADYFIVASNNSGKIQWNRGNDNGVNSGLAVNTKEGYHPVKFIIETSANVDIFTSDVPYTSPAEATENPVETLAKGENTYIIPDGVRNFAIRPNGTKSMSVTKLVIFYEADEEVAAPEIPTIEFDGFEPEITSYMLGDYNNSVTINLSHADADIWHKFVKANAPLQAAEAEADDRDGFNLHDGTPITITEPGILHVYAEKNGKRSETKTIEFVDGSSSITNIEAAGNNAPVEYFNLQGIRIDNPAAGSVVIRRQGSDIRKIVVR